MTDQVWNGSQGFDSEPAPEDGGTYIRVNGSNVAVGAGTSFGATVTETAKNAGLGKFRVFMDGNEVKPADAPDMIEAGMNVELRPYDVAG